MNRAPTVVWGLRLPPARPNGWVRTNNDDTVEIGYTDEHGVTRGFDISRRDARLLAKRINECLDYTVKK